MKKLIVIALLVPTIAMAAGYREVVSGKKLTYVDATCAGVSFSKNGDDAYMYGEQGQCEPVLSLRVKWLSDKTAMLIEKNRRSNDSPPRVYVMQFKSLNGNKVKVKDVWTGWGDQPDVIDKYLIK